MKLLLCCAALICTAAEAHDQWLETEPVAPVAGKSFKLYLQVGEHLSSAEPALLKSRDRYARFAAITSKGRRDLLATLREDTQPIAVVPMEKASMVIALDSTTRQIELDAEKFAAYLLEERLINVLAQRVERNEEDVPGREKYSRSMKTLVFGADDELLLKPIGQDLEVVPLTSPRKATGTLKVQVLLKGKPLPGAALTIASRSSTVVKAQHLRTGPDGKAELTFARSGDWFIGLVHMERSTEPDADWRSYWSSLTFHVD